MVKHATCLVCLAVLSCGSDAPPTAEAGAGGSTVAQSSSSGSTSMGTGGTSVGGAGGQGGSSTCGDGVVQLDEACDDGNDVTGDGCHHCTRVVGLSLGGSHSCALISDGRVKCWGSNGFGELGQGDQFARGDQSGEMGDALAPIALGAGHSAIGISAGTFYTCALLAGGAIKCWGANAYLQLGLPGLDHRGDDPGEMGDDLPVLTLGTSVPVSAVAAGLSHTCAITEDGAVRCWGMNTWAEVGLGFPSRAELPSTPVSLGTGHTATQVSTGYLRTCAILDDDSLKCWGQMGQPYGEPLPMGDALPIIALGTGRTATDVAVARNHACVLLDDATVKCFWGNGDGQLGLGHTTPQPADGDSLPPVDLGTGRTAVAIAARDRYSCALLDDDTVKCWGFNNRGQLGQGDTNSRGNEPGEMGDALPPISLGTGRTVRTVATGDAHACALLDDDTVKCWGWNAYGQLGLGDSINRGDTANSMGDALPTVALP